MSKLGKKPINIPKDTNFSIKVGNQNLRAGTKYDYTITVTNNISSTNSAASASQTSPFTRLPSSNSIGTSLTLTEGITETFLCFTIKSLLNVVSVERDIGKRLIPLRVNSRE